MRTRHVILRVQNVPWMEDYHGREARLIGELVEALEVTTDKAVAYVDDRDGEASELAEAVISATEAHQLQGSHGTGRTVERFRAEFESHCARRFLHGEVQGVRRVAA